MKKGRASLRRPAFSFLLHGYVIDGVQVADTYAVVLAVSQGVLNITGLFAVLMQRPAMQW